MPKAYYFEDALDLCDFIKLAGSSLRSSQGYELFQTPNPRRPSKTSFLLTGARLPKLSWKGLTFPKVDFQFDEDQGISWKPHGATNAEVIDRRIADTVFDFVELEPWRHEDQHEQHIIFWLNDADLMPEVVRESFRLRNDRIQYAKVGDTPLIRIERPSFYLLQRCLEDFADSIEIYYPVEEDLYVQWGYQHPLDSLWKESERNRGGGWVFFRIGCETRQVERLHWQDAYELTEFKFEFPTEAIRAQSSTRPLKFTIPLRLSQRASFQADPELWLLDETGLAQLEGVLQLIDEDQVRPYHLAIQKTETAEDLLFVREKRTGKDRKHLDFNGRAFSTYQGLNHFFLPIGYDLLPPLRRDVYRDLFELEHGVLTVVIPNDDGDIVRIVRIRERAFQPLTSFLDYIVERDIEILSDRLDKSIFDLGDYLSAASHPGLAKAKKEKEEKSTISAAAEVATKSGKEGMESNERPSIDDLIGKSGDASEEQLRGLQQHERDLERELIKEQTPENWRNLAVCKGRLGKPEEGLLAAIEGTWVSPDDGYRHTFGELVGRQISNFPDFIPGIDHIVGTEQEGFFRAVLFQHLGAKPDADDPPGEVDQWVAETTTFLEHHEQHYRAKERWLAWGAIISLNRDERREAQIREMILNQIAEGGLGIDETPSFIRTRIFLDRGRDNDEEGASGGIDAALANLVVLEEVTRGIRSSLLGKTFEAIIARAYSRIGHIGRALEILDDKYESGEFTAWRVAFAYQAIESEVPDRAKEFRENLAQQLRAADPDTHSAITELQEIHKRRTEIDNPAAFLAHENRSRSYPTGGVRKGELHQLSEKLREYRQAGDEPNSVQTVHAMMTLDDKSGYDDHVRLPEVVELIVTAIEQLKWGERGAGLMPVFEQFASKAPGYLSKGDPFYLSLLHTNLATGLIVSENLEAAGKYVERAATTIGETQTELDFIDGCAAVIGLIEQLPLELRRELIGRLAIMMRDRFDNNKTHYLKQGRPLTAVVRLLEQFAEAAISKDRLSLNQFKNYQLQDEFLVLQRVQRENLSNS